MRFAPAACAGALALALGGCARADDGADRYTEFFNRLHPSVVLFTMQIPADDPKRKGQWDAAYGSGVVVASGPAGSRILTDAHVVADARKLRATIGDVRPSVPATVTAVSDDDDDLALIDVPAPALPAVRLGRPAQIVPGLAIGVLGYPIPDAFEDEHLRTVVSLYAGRVASVRNGTIEVDVPVIPGESGGPVFDAHDGSIIGIAESRFDDERAIGFVTPVDVIDRFLAAHHVATGTAR
jgi:S1-C subfamily serine protease